MLFSAEELLKATGGSFSGNPLPGGICRISTDSRENLENAMFLAVPGEKFDGHDYFSSALKQGAALLCCETAKAAKLPFGAPVLLVDSTLEAYRKLANFHRRKFKKLKLAALTGSSGKTSTKEMLRAIFEEAYGKEHVLATEGNTNNHIGVPRNLLKLTEKHKAAVIEMGTNHKGEIRVLASTAEPDGAMIVSIGHCHLESFKTLEGVAEEKSDIFLFTKKGAPAVIPSETAGKEIMVKKARDQKITFFGHGKESRIEAKYLGGNIQGSRFELLDRSTGEKVLVQWKLSGSHQAENASGAATLALEMGIQLPVIAKGLSNCVLPGMRMKITEHGKAQWINDAYNANPDSMKATLRWLSEFADAKKLVLVLGDMRELGDHAQETHDEMLLFARKLFPEARLCAVGPCMRLAAEKMTGGKDLFAFASSQDAAGHIPVREGDIVFLKASRGTQLELVEPK